MLNNRKLFFQFGMFETVSSGLVDTFPKLLHPRKLQVTVGLCVTMFILSLPLTTNVSNIPYVTSVLNFQCEYPPNFILYYGVFYFYKMIQIIKLNLS